MKIENNRLNLFKQGPGQGALPADRPHTSLGGLTPNEFAARSRQEQTERILVMNEGNQGARSLRVLVDLCHSHALASDGGVIWRPSTGIRRVYERIKVGERGPYVVWGFSPGTTASWLTAPLLAPHRNPSNKENPGKAFWEAWNLLVQMGLVELVPHVVEADTAEAEVIHPFPGSQGEPAERVIYGAAHNAACSLLTEDQCHWAEERGLILLPSFKHLENVQMIGVARLRHRPHTKATSEWYGSMAQWSEWATRYMEIAAAYGRPLDATSRLVQR